ncbi:MAG: hypothetical protein ABJZ55_11480 [Fuerstiella sp.]
MSRQLIRTASAMVILTTTSLASAQFFGSNGCSSCGTSASYARPVATASNCAPVQAVSQCTPIQPVYSACYQTVPVTTYKRETQKVEVPEYYTDYEDRDVTTYTPVTRTREVEVPTVSYRTVSENRTVTRDMGRWVTNYQPVAKCAPCQVDPRPGMMGWLNRTGYSFRSAFTPNYRTSRQYVPKMMACNVPYTRQVAVRGTKKVAVQETQMVAKTTKQRVAVQRVRMTTKTVQVARPVTAYRSVPIGSTLAYGGTGSSFAYGGYGLGGSSIAFLPDEDDRDVRSARRPEPDAAFSGDRRESADRRNDRDGEDRPFRGSAFERELPSDPLKPVDSAVRSPFADEADDAFPGFDDARHESRRPAYSERTRAHRPIASRGWSTSRSVVAERNNGNQSREQQDSRVAAVERQSRSQDR